MYIYKFRLLFDEIDDFVRDYEISAQQTFKDFHNIIIQSIERLGRQELASFYICDRRWNKTQEITLLDMEMGTEDEPKMFIDEELGDIPMPKIMMENAVMSDFMNDPHQRIIYEYDFLNLKTFYIELLKSFQGDDRKTYPLCSFSSGELPISVSDLKNIQMLDDDAVIEEDTAEDFYDDEDLESLNTDFEDSI